MTASTTWRCLASIVLLASRAFAQPPAVPDASARARAHDEVVAAVAAFNRGDYQLALERFRGAYTLAPVVELRFNIGLCLERLGRLREALETYQSALADGTLDAEGHARATERIDDVRRRIATVSFVGPPGGSARVDADPACNIPCEVTVDPGTHTWSVALGARSASGTIATSPGTHENVDATVSAADAERPPPAPPRAGWSPGWLFWTGLGTALVGGAGIVGFGVRSNDLLGQYTAAPTAGIADEGDLVTALANVAIAIAVAGAIAMLIDVLIGALQ